MLCPQVRPVTSGTRTLKDATSEAIRDWVTNVETTHYILGSVAGPHPFPMMVRALLQDCGLWSAGRKQGGGRGLQAGHITPSLPLCAACALSMGPFSSTWLQVRDFHACIGRETRRQAQEQWGACLGLGHTLIMHD